MKILFSAIQYPTKDYPFAAFIAMMAEEMARRGHEVTIIAPQSITHSLIRRTPLHPEHEIIENNSFRYPINIYRPKAVTFGEGKFRGRFTVKALQWSALKCLNTINKNFDVAYSHFWQSAFHILPYVKKRNVPLVVVSGEDEIRLHKYLHLNEIKTINSYLSKVICVSSKNKKESISTGLANYERCIVIPNGPDIRSICKIEKIKARKDLGFNIEDFIVCFVGRFIHRKGALRTEQAILKLNNPLIKAIFIGSSMKDEDASQEPFGPEIIFKGIIPHDEVGKYLSASDIFVLPTLAEGCSNSIVEAMACGLPIVSSDYDFNYDVLNNNNAILVNPLDITHISFAIDTLFKDKTLCESMSEASLRKAFDISFEKRVDKTIDVLNSVVS